MFFFLFRKWTTVLNEEWFSEKLRIRFIFHNAEYFKWIEIKIVKLWSIGRLEPLTKEFCGLRQAN